MAKKDGKTKAAQMFEEICKLYPEELDKEKKAEFCKKHKFNENAFGYWYRDSFNTIFPYLEKCGIDLTPIKDGKS